MSGRLTEPVEIVLDLPFPPSMNRIWRAGGRKSTGGRAVYGSDEYRDWMREADNLVMARRAFPKRKIHGAFSAEVTLSRAHGRGDVDNRIKPLLDYAQSRDLIRNDSDCQRVTAEWGEAEAGCRVVLREWPT
jgi:Holliday junction resolvase RusA-like endonuclease